MNIIEKIFSLGVSEYKDDGANLSVVSSDRKVIDWYYEDDSGAATYLYTRFSNKPKAIDGPYVNRRTGKLLN